ncbi:phosphotransferase family protein [Sclerotinia borealis F-4128]|uniref:Phosphotransferase family protein n=1 Tax=Sclerotinia borealis (strain F-4128) TaxID=1432307 RepID=W9CQ80_SCLBF|nr:phosphotransferase family protein [Sclerotinia borealis F-4128]
MSSSGAKYTEQQKADRSAVTAALTDPKNARVMQDKGDSSLKKRTTSQATVSDRSKKATKAAKAAKKEKKSSMDYDLIIERSRESILQNWIATVRDEDVIRLVARYRPGQPECTIESVLGGSFNVCFKIAFADGLRWIVRVPKPGRVMFMEKKVRDEVAVIKYIKSTTSIPVPDIIAFGTADDNVGGFGPFMITEFICGDNLGVKLFDTNSNQDFEESIYRQIAGFLLQLSKCRFDKIGSLFMDSNGYQPTWSVKTKPLTLAINETLRGGCVNLYGISEPYASTSEYFQRTAEQKLDHVLQQQNSIDNREDAIKKLNRRRLFKSITAKFVHSDLDHGPFTLVCDDFRPGNMLVRDGKIVAVFDWEWTYAGPLELLLSPPRWLCKDWPAVWDLSKRAAYDTKVKKFLEILQEEEMKIIKSGPAIMSNLMEESWNRSGKFEYHQLLGEVFLFDEDWLWERIEADYASEVHSQPDDTSIIDGKLVDFEGYLAMSRPMRIFDYISSKSLAKCSYCWACLHPGWMNHDIRDCVQVPRDDSTVSVMEAAAACRSKFAYPEGSDIHVECGAPHYLGCTDRLCLYQLTAYSVYVAVTGKARHLHEEAWETFSEHYNVDITNIRPEELIKVMARPHQVASRTVSALVWFIELMHDDAESSFQWYSQYGL